MNNEVTDLHIDKFNITGILVKSSKKASKIQMEKYTAEGAKQIVNFTIENGEDQSFNQVL